MRGLAAISVMIAAMAATARGQEPELPPVEPPGAVSGAAQPSATQPRPGSMNLQDMSVSELLAEAEELQEIGQYQGAVTLLQAVIDRDPGNVEAMIKLGRVSELVRDALNARNWYQKAYEITPQDHRVLLGLGRVHLNSNNYRLAITYLSRAETTAPPDARAEVLANLAVAYRGSGRARQAQAAAEEAIAADPSNAIARQILVGIQLERNNYDNALMNADTLIDIKQQEAIERGGDLAAYRSLAQAYQVKWQALDRYHKSLYVPNPNGEASDRLIEGNEKRAAELLRRMVEVRIIRNEIDNQITLLETITLARRAAELDPENPSGLMQLGKLYEATGQAEFAEQTYRRVLELAPDHVEARSRLEALGADVAARGANETKQP